MILKSLISKLLTLTIFLGFLTAQASDLDVFFKKTEKLMSAYVHQGKVDYQALSANPMLLNEAYSLAGRIEVEKTDANNYKAFWINAYNLSVIKAITDAYPIKSPMDLPGFFDSRKHYLGGVKMTLNYLENELLRANFKEPRFHFVLVCGALSCPIIENFAYLPNKLEAQLEAQARKALNNDEFLKVDAAKKKVKFSQIFKWYQEDFAEDKKGLIDYVNPYRKNKIAANSKVSYYDYDWTLNNGKSPNALRQDSPSKIEWKPIERETIENKDIIDARQISPNNLQTFTPGSLLKKGQSDFTMFNTIYTESKSNWKGDDFDGFRTTFATSQLQWTYGISENNRVNLGVDVFLKGSGTTGSTDSYSAIDRAFLFTNTDSTRFGVGAIGARIKVSPIKGVNNFAIQSSLIISPVQNPEGFRPNSTDRYWIEWDRFIWWNQFFYDKTFGSRNQFQVFAEADLLFRFKRRSYQSSLLDIPTNLFLSYFPTPKITVYVMSQYVPRLVFDTELQQTVNGVQVPETTDWVIAADYFASGVGFKYQFSSQLNVELLYTNFWKATNGGLGETFNIGIKYLTK